MAVAAVFNFGECQSPVWMKLYVLNLMGRCNTAKWRWTRDQKSKPEVNLRDVIKRTSGTTGCRSQTQEL